MIVRTALLSLALISTAQAESFDQMWYGRVAFPPQDGVASMYDEDFLDARGKRFEPDKVSCAHRTEKFGRILVVTNLRNGKKIDCPVQDRGPYKNGRVLDLSRGAARALGCTKKEGLCPVIVRRKGYEDDGGKFTIIKREVIIDSVSEASLPIPGADLSGIVRDAPHGQKVWPPIDHGVIGKTALYLPQ